MKKLDEREWAPRAISDEFAIFPGRRLESRNRKPGKHPFIGALDNTNGVVQFVSDVNESLDSNVLGVNYSGNGMGIGFYHPYGCVFSDDVKRFHFKNAHDCEELALFAKAVIAKQRDKFGYLYKFNAKRMAATSIMMPVGNSGVPDYAFMSEYVRQKREELLTRYSRFVSKRIGELGEYVEIPALNEKEWRKFSAFGPDGLFEIATTSSSIDSIRLIDGEDKTVPYITRTNANNGIARFVSSDNLSYGSDCAGCITVGLDTQTAFWQPSEFITGQNVQVITGERLSFYLAQFLIPLLKSQMQAKFSWGGNGATLGRMKKLELMLPADGTSEPDYEYMEQYAKNLLLRKYRQYLSFLGKGDYD